MTGNLIGRVVALEAVTLPATLKDWIGTPAVVGSVDSKSKLVLITFADNTQCEIHPKHLIMLKRQGDIFKKLIRSWNLSTDDFQTVNKVSNLMLKGAFADAIQLAISNDAVRGYCTVNCGEWLNRKKVKQERKRKRL